MGPIVILGDFLKAVAQLTDRRFRRVLWRGIGLTIALLFAAYAGFLYLLNALGAEQWITDTIGQVTWVGSFLTWGSLFLVLFLSVFLMVPVASAITSLFLDEVADAVEARHYPHVADTPNVGFWAGLKDTINFLGILIAANLIAVLLWIWFPPIAPIVFWGVNGYLLGREYFQVAARRHLDGHAAKELYRANRGRVWMAGTLMAMPLTIPLLNLFIPVLGAATFTHQFHRLNGTAKR